MTHALARSAARLASLCFVALAHEGDPKERDFKGPYVGPAWLADEHVGDKAAGTSSCCCS